MSSNYVSRGPLLIGNGPSGSGNSQDILGVDSNFQRFPLYTVVEGQTQYELDYL